MSKRVKKTWEEPVDDSTEGNLPEEFRFNPHRLERVPAGVKKAGVHLYLDEDVLEYFKKLAAQPNAAAWQTHINQALRQVMEWGRAAETGAALSDGELEKIIGSDPFVRSVADRIADRVASKLRRKAKKKAA